VLEGAIAEIGGGDRCTPGISADGVGADEARASAVPPLVRRIGEADFSGKAVPPEIAADLNIKWRAAAVVAGIGQRFWFWPWFRRWFWSWSWFWSW